MYLSHTLCVSDIWFVRCNRLLIVQRDFRGIFYNYLQSYKLVNNAQVECCAEGFRGIFIIIYRATNWSTMLKWSDMKMICKCTKKYGGFYKLSCSECVHLKIITGTSVVAAFSSIVDGVVKGHIAFQKGDMYTL
jgi:hypothetical protein